MKLRFDDDVRTAYAAWERVAGAYRQYLDVLRTGSDYLPRALPAFLAELLARLSASYYGDEPRFVKDLWTVFSKVRARVGEPSPTRSSVYHDPLLTPAILPTGIPGRTVPTPWEAAIETIRRMRDLRSIETVLNDAASAVLVGGSVSYGRFLNVRGGRDPSDLDILVVIKTFDSLSSVLQQIGGRCGAPKSDIQLATERAREFANFLRSNKKSPCVFSAKLKLWESNADPFLDGCDSPSEYSLSLHVVSMQGLGQLVLKDAPIIASSIISDGSPVLDYRESRPSRGDKQRSFSGRSIDIPIDVTTDGSSFVRETRLFVIDDHSYYPGMFQNLVLPVFDVRWGDSECRRLVDSFRWKMIDRLRYEQRVHPNELLRLSFAHTRSEVFAPHVVRAVDASTLLG